jgi:hypothetical protein
MCIGSVPELSPRVGVRYQARFWAWARLDGEDWVLRTYGL